MKKTIITLAMFVAGASLSFAQVAKTQLEKKKVENKEAVLKPAPRNEKSEMKHKARPAERANAKTEEMNQVVNLDEAQKSKIAIINKEQNEKMKEVRTAFRDKDDKSGMKEKVSAIQKERKTKTRAVLNEEQKVMWKKHQQAKRESKSAVERRPEQAK